MTRSNVATKPLSILALAAAAVLAAPLAHADGATYEYPTTVTSKLTRAEVQAQLQQSKSQANPWSTSYSQAANSKSVLSRDAVRADVASEQGRIAAQALSAEDGGALAMSRNPALAAPAVMAQAR